MIANVFHPADFSSGDETAFAHALRIALAARGKLSLLHVQPKGTRVHRQDFPRVRKFLSNWKVLPGEGFETATLDHLGIEVKKVARAGNDPAEVITKFVAHHVPDLLVLSTHQRKGVNRWLLPSLAEKTAEKSRTPTLFVPRSVKGFVALESGALKLETILIPVSNRPNPQRSANAAAAFARMLGVTDCKFVFLFVGPEEKRPKVEVDLIAGWTSQKITTNGSVVNEIIAHSRFLKADLLVMATRGRDDIFDQVRGSTTERVLREAQCPLLAVPA